MVNNRLLKGANCILCFINNTRNNRGRHNFTEINKGKFSIATDFIFRDDGSYKDPIEVLGEIVHLVTHGVGKGRVDKSLIKSTIDNDPNLHNLALMDRRAFHPMDFTTMYVEWLATGAVSPFDRSLGIQEQIVAQMGAEHSCPLSKEEVLKLRDKVEALVNNEKLDKDDLSDVEKRVLQSGPELSSSHLQLRESFKTPSEILATKLRTIRRQTNSISEMVEVAKSYTPEQAVSALIDVNQL